MLTKMYLTNFLSFEERTEFDFTSSKYSILDQTNVYNGKNLKGALFIGGNASGKSNALKGISFLIKMLKGEENRFPGYRCFFSKTTVTTTEYEFDIENRHIVYTIEFDISNYEISEVLMIEDKCVLKRNGSIGKLIYGESEIVDENIDRDTLFLRISSFNTGRFPHEPVLQKLMDYLQNSYIIDGYNNGAAYGRSINQYAEQYGVDKINKYLERFGYDFTIEYGSRCEGEGLTIAVGEEKKAIFLKRKSYPIPMIIINESQGNQVFADLMPYLINIIEKPGMLIIDEFGNSFHNVLSERIIRFFMENALNSQIFITSHHSNLISNSVFRPDQINLISFQNKNGSKVVRLSKFKPREAQNLEKMYLGGMFEGLPDYENL